MLRYSSASFRSQSLTHSRRERHEGHTGCLATRTTVWPASLSLSLLCVCMLSPSHKQREKRSIFSEKWRNRHTRQATACDLSLGFELRGRKRVKRVLCASFCRKGNSSSSSSSSSSSTSSSPSWAGHERLLVVHQKGSHAFFLIHSILLLLLCSCCCCCCCIIKSAECSLSLVPLFLLPFSPCHPLLPGSSMPAPTSSASRSPRESLSSRAPAHLPLSYGESERLSSVKASVALPAAVAPAAESERP